MSGSPSRSVKRPARYTQDSDLEEASSELSNQPSDEESSSDSVVSGNEQPSCGRPSVPQRGRGSCRGRGRGQRVPPHHSPPRQQWKTADDPDEAGPTPPQILPKTDPRCTTPFHYE